MARQGNYVTVNGDANWAKGISGSLADLSKSLLAQGAAEDERARLAAAEAENKRRYEENKAFEQQKYDDLIARQKEADRIAEKERTRLENQRQALQTYLTNYSSQDAAEAALARDPELKKSLDEQFAANRETLAENALIAATKAQQLPLAEGLKEVAGESMGLTQDLIPEDAYAAIMAAREANPDSPMIKAFDAELAKLEQQQKDYLLSMPVYQEQENARIRREMGIAGVDPNVIAANAKDLSGAYQSRKDVSAEALAWQKAQNAQAKEIADQAYKALSLANKNTTANGGNSNYIKPKDISILEATNTINEKFDANGILPFDRDNTDFLNWFKAGTEAGIPGSIVMRALEDKVDDTIFGRSEKGNVQDFLAYAKAMEQANTANKSGRSYEEYMKLITPEITPYVDPIKANRDAFIGGALNMRPERQGLPLIPFTSTNTDLPALAAVANTTTNTSTPSRDVIEPNYVEGPDRLRRDPMTGKVVRPKSGMWNSSGINTTAREELDAARAAREKAAERERLNAELVNRSNQMMAERAAERARIQANGPVDIYADVNIPRTLKEGLQNLTPFPIGMAPKDPSVGDLKLDPQEQRTMVFLSNRSSGYLEDMLKKPNLTAAERKLIPIILQSRR